MAQNFAEKGYSIKLFGFDDIDEKISVEQSHTSLCEAIKNSDAVILPLPVTRSGVTLNAPHSKNPIMIKELSEYLDRGQKVFAGMISGELKSTFYEKGIKVYDYFEREELIVRNAIPTAQGVIKIIIENMPITIHGSTIAVIGFGRTAKVLVKMLKGLGANITVAARKCDALVWADIEGCEGVYINELSEKAKKFDILINTVPTLVVDEAILSKLKKDCLIIEIASAPWGIDFSAAQELGLSVVRPGSLPGKVAPKTAGKIVCDAIINIIKEVDK